MIIPCIDLMGGRVVQLRQGRDLVLERDLAETIAAFAGFPLLHVIDLDAALGLGDNAGMVERVAANFTVRVGGGIRSVAAAKAAVAAGANQVILGSAAFRDGQPDQAFVRVVARSIGLERVIVAIDSLGGKIAVKGWRETLKLSPAEAMAAFEPVCAGFLCTCVDREGKLGGTDLALFADLRAQTTKRLVAAGGITTIAEVEELSRQRIDVALGMAIYQGHLNLEELRRLNQ
ncbi:MAG: hypothetical protein JNJ45_11780 [Chthonomonas sp.]|nr:hypothetical protein [Chthonomonas sp.]